MEHQNILAIFKGTLLPTQIHIPGGRSACTDSDRDSAATKLVFPPEKFHVQENRVLHCQRCAARDGGCNRSGLQLSVHHIQEDKKRASRANSYIAEFLGARASKPEVSWHSDRIPFPVCAQNNSGLFGAEVGQTFECRYKSLCSVQLFGCSFENALGFDKITIW